MKSWKAVRTAPIPPMALATSGDKFPSMKPRPAARMSRESAMTPTSVDDEKSSQRQSLTPAARCPAAKSPAEKSMYSRRARVTTAAVESRRRRPRAMSRAPKRRTAGHDTKEGQHLNTMDTPASYHNVTHRRRAQTRFRARWCCGRPSRRRRHLRVPWRQRSRKHGW